MIQEPESYDIYPKVIPANQKSTVTICPIFLHSGFNDESEYEVIHVPMEIPLKKKEPYTENPESVKSSGGVLEFAKYFSGEQEHLLSVFEINGNTRKHVGDFYVYSLEKDLYERYPYKGDLHMHSIRSDGKESPGYVAAACRKIGLDFMALTDHGQYAPSIEAQEAFKDIDLDFKIFRGEEVHAPQNPLHIINFGGSFSVNDLFSKDPDGYAREVKDIESQLGQVPEDMDTFQYASSVWVFDKIREAGGLGIYCHPYWVYYNLEDPMQGYYISSGLISHVFDKQPYDAYELLGGYFRNEVNSNILQVARYNEERAKGRKIPIVGVTDAHGCETGELFGWYYTIVFSHSTELQDLIGGIKGLYSVAVEALPGEAVRVYGPFRLVKYALFLIREVFSAHDKLCFEEGSLMIDYVNGNKDAAAKLQNLKGQTLRLLEKVMGRKSKNR